MFNLLKKKPIEIKNQCNHNLISLGKFYIIDNTPYMNDNDHIYIKLRLVCSKCNKTFDETLSERLYKVMSINDCEEKLNYIEYLKNNKEIIEDYEMQEKTIQYFLNKKENN